MKLDLKTSLLAAADLLLPRHCVVCGRELLMYERAICTCCLADLPLCRMEDMVHNPMADRFNAVIEALRNEDSGYEPYAYATALFNYLEGYQNITPALKYRRNFRVGKYFAGMLGERVAASPLYKDVDCVIPVPLHWTRRWRRGYNQAAVLAREVATALGAELRSDLLVRCRRTTSQTRLDKIGKSLNVEGAFRYSGKPCKGFAHILLVDDVFTTGSTLAGCHCALRKAFPVGVRISAAALALVE